MMWTVNEEVIEDKKAIDVIPRIPESLLEGVTCVMDGLAMQEAATDKIVEGLIMLQKEDEYKKHTLLWGKYQQLVEKWEKIVKEECLQLDTGTSFSKGVH